MGQYKKGICFIISSIVNMFPSIHYAVHISGHAWTDVSKSWVDKVLQLPEQ